MAKKKKKKTHKKNIVKNDIKITYKPKKNYSLKKPKEPIGDKVYDFIDELCTNVKLGFKMAVKKNSKEITLDDLIREFAVREKISFILASVIVINCVLTSLAKKRERIQLHEEIIEELKENLNAQNIVIEPLVNKVREVFESYEIVEETVELTLDEKIEIILDKYSITYEQFLIVALILILEGGVNNYVECYNVANTLYNRINCSSIIDFVENIMGKGTGVSLYYQAICPAQYTTYKSDDYNKLLGTDLSEYAGFKAVVDMFYSEESVHDYMRFVAPRLRDTQPSAIPLTKGGNYYHRVLQDYERVSLEEILPNYSKYLGEDGYKKVYTLVPVSNK